MTAHLIAEDGPLQGLILNLEDGDEWILGRSPETADLIIDESTVSRKHAKLTRSPEGIYLKNLSKVNPTLINGEEHRENVLLKEGDRVQIGETTFIFSEEKIPGLKPVAKKTKQKKQSYDDIFEELKTPEEETPIPSESTGEETVHSKKAEIPLEPEESSSSYDTIFEDIPEESGVPFSLPADTPFLLKVVSGPNAGAEIGMEKGRAYILGKDAQSCDILFQDLSVSRSHAQISISKEGVMEIEDLGSKNGTVVNGTPIQEKQTITAQDIVSLGTTVFIIIDREAPQETIYAPLSLSQGEAEKPASEDLEPQEEKVAKDWKQEPIPYKHLIFAGSIAAVFLVAFFSFFSLFKSKNIEIVHKEPTSEIQKALADKKFSAVAFSFNPASGKLFVTGHVLTNVDYQEMRYSLSLLPYISHIEDTVVIDDGVARITNEVLSSNDLWKGISIRAVEPGKFIVAGYLQTMDEMAQVSEYLAVNFPYLDRLENKIAVEEILNTEVGSLLVRSGFSAVSYQLNRGEIVLSGVYNHHLTSEFRDLIHHLEHLNAITSVKNFAIPTSPQLAAINLSNQFAVSGISFHEGKGFNAVLNGRVYMLGDSVDGMNIIDIEEHTILLEKDGVKYRIDISL